MRRSLRTGVAADQLLVRPVARLGSRILRLPSPPATGAAEAAAAEGAEEEEEEEDRSGKDASASAKERRKKGGKGGAKAEAALGEAWSHARALGALAMEGVELVYANPVSCLLRIALGAYAVYWCVPRGREFYDYSHQLAEGLSQPQIMFKAKTYNGQEVMVDDYREAYWWLRDKTPEDARVMAWWDYGYQITGIGERTTIADGNTWNHEHIATLGLILSGNEQKAHSIARHLADYVLVWAGGGGDDLAKSPHMARIGNSVFRDICPGDPTCSKFGFYQGGQPTPMMEECLLYKLTMHGQRGIAANESLFQHVFTSRYGKVRIFKVRRVSLKSKKWVADPANRRCDAPGSWYCVGQYPPALAPLIARRKNFAQLEDFNTKRSSEDEAYDKEYHERMSGRKGPSDGPGGGGGSKGRPGLWYLGCVGAEALLGEERTYSGGADGSTLAEARAFAKEAGSRYVALARSGMDGHAFAIPALPPGWKAGSLDDAGCSTPCLDFQEYGCGCADELCAEAGVSAVRGEEHVRRWAIYEVVAKGKKKAKKGSPKDEM
uniref:STT3/PglB/AglB core domain-containing protein n=1 Tax=Emiliania huxleyi TaxID=2903 RepID=A0A7S3WZI2_EMIHU